MTELIDKYLRGELEDADRLAFEARVREDSHFAEEVKAQLKGEYAIRIQAKASVRAALKADFALLASKSAIAPVRPLYRRREFWLAAAAAAVLLLFSLRYWGSAHQMSADEIYAAYLQPEPISVSRSDQDTALLRLATAYQSASYAQAIKEAQLLLNDPHYASSANIWLSLAISQLMTDQPQAALTSLLQIDTGSAFYGHAQWYEALALLKVDRALALEKLREIAGSEHYMRDQATDILEKMEDE